jgi:hypothetical protein
MADIHDVSLPLLPGDAPLDTRGSCLAGIAEQHTDVCAVPTTDALTTVASERDAAQAELTEVRRTAVQLQSELAEMKAAACSHALDVEGLRAEVATAEAREREAAQRADSLGAECATLERRVSEFEAALRMEQKALAAAEVEAMDAEERAKALAAEGALFERRLSDAEAAAGSAGTEVRAVRQQAAKLAADKRALNEQLREGEVALRQAARLRRAAAAAVEASDGVSDEELVRLLSSRSSAVSMVVTAGSVREMAAVLGGPADAAAEEVMAAAARELRGGDALKRQIAEALGGADSSAAVNTDIEIMQQVTECVEQGSAYCALQRAASDMLGAPQKATVGELCRLMQDAAVAQEALASLRQRAAAAAGVHADMPVLDDVLCDWIQSAAAIRHAYDTLRKNFCTVLGTARDEGDEMLLKRLRQTRATNLTEDSSLKHAVSTVLGAPAETPIAELAAQVMSMRDAAAVQRGLAEALGARTAAAGTASAEELLEEVRALVGACEQCKQLQRENAALWEQKVAETRKRHDADWESECAVEKAEAAAADAAALRGRVAALEAEAVRLEEGCAEAAALRQEVADLECRCGFSNTPAPTSLTPVTSSRSHHFEASISAPVDRCTCHHHCDSCIEPFDGAVPSRFHVFGPENVSC